MLNQMLSLWNQKLIHNGYSGIFYFTFHKCLVASFFQWLTHFRQNNQQWTHLTSIQEEFTHFDDGQVKVV